MLKSFRLTIREGIEVMFEIGKWYTVWMIDAEHGEGYSSYKVVDFQAPLLKLHNPYENDLVVNVGSQMFVKAQLSEHQGEHERGRPLMELSDWPDPGQPE
jgi:hypothetical protein